MSDFGIVLGRIRSLQERSWGWQGLCPAHDDGRSSLSLRVSEQGHLLAKCHAGCSFDQIVEATGLRKCDFMKPSERVMSREVASYDYTDETGQVLFQVVRFEPKDFRQRRKTATGWEWGMGDTRRVIYRLDRIAKAHPTRTIFLVEGEKDVHTLEKHGFLATTSPMGAGKWHDDYAKCLKGRAVVAIPDNDKPGQDHMNTAVLSLAKHGADPCLLNPYGTKNYKDITDWFSLGNGHDNDAAYLKSLAMEAQKEQAELNEAARLANRIIELGEAARWRAAMKILGSLENQP